MMNDEKQFDLETYMARGVENVVKSIVATSLFHPKERKFIARFAKASKEATARRKRFSDAGTHIPPFLIASITSRCNLHCAGCYARSFSTCEDGEPVAQLDAAEWSRLFHEASALGISFILLAGGEPMVRPEVIREAAGVPDILFPVFTNGTMLRAENLDLFDRNRNLFPVLSIEGDAEQTDARRGHGIYRILTEAMENMKKQHIAFGASITVTKNNLATVTGGEWIEDLSRRGCKVFIFVEYVPTSGETAHLAPDDDARRALAERIDMLRGQKSDTLFLSFPGDEQKSNGCLAAGRGFFHINSHGGAEPCPFSPYSDMSVRGVSLLEALKSPLFSSLRESGLLVEDHAGGCVLFERRAQVEALHRGSGEKNGNELKKEKSIC